jgi:hypothetical protein
MKVLYFYVTFVARFVRSEQLFVVSTDQSALAQVDKFFENTYEKQTTCKEDRSSHGRQAQQQQNKFTYIRRVA